jgi:hypothetical protein
MGLKRIQHVLAMVVALFVLGASSQAAVCELACGLQVHTSACHAGMTSDMPGMAMEHSAPAESSRAAMPPMHCSHGMVIPVVPGMHSVGSCLDGACSHTAVAAFAKSGSANVSFAAVQWVTVAIVTLNPMVPANYLGVGNRPSLPIGVDPLLDRLRV